MLFWVSFRCYDDSFEADPHVFSTITQSPTSIALTPSNVSMIDQVHFSKAWAFYRNLLPSFGTLIIHDFEFHRIVPFDSWASALKALFCFIISHEPLWNAWSLSHLASAFPPLKAVCLDFFSSWWANPRDLFDFLSRLRS